MSPFYINGFVMDACSKLFKRYKTLQCTVQLLGVNTCNNTVIFWDTFDIEMIWCFLHILGQLQEHLMTVLVNDIAGRHVDSALRSQDVLLGVISVRNITTTAKWCIADLQMWLESD